MNSVVMERSRLSPSVWVQDWLSDAGIAVNGDQPWDIQVHRDRVYGRVLAHGSLGAGESYMDGDWDARKLDQMLYRALRARVDAHLPTVSERWLEFKSWMMNRQAVRRAFAVGQVHYDVGDDVYHAMLDPRMIYTCGYWAEADNLADAQEAKLDLVGRKLGLLPGMRVLDIGCGWGGSARYLAERFGVSVVGVTVSAHQAQACLEHAGSVDFEVRYQDYRALTGRFDRIYSLGMFEHVGVSNYGHYFDLVRQLLAPDGLFLLHTIGARTVRRSNDPWVERYIFPNSYVPARSEIARALESRFVVEDWHAFGPDYDRTLMAWMANFEMGWPALAGQYSERFRRMWLYWLAGSAASFRVRDLDLWQVLLSPNGVPGGLAEQR